MLLRAWGVARYGYILILDCVNLSVIYWRSFSVNRDLEIFFATLLFYEKDVFGLAKSYETLIALVGVKLFKFVWIIGGY